MQEQTRAPEFSEQEKWLLREIAALARNILHIDFIGAIDYGISITLIGFMLAGISGIFDPHLPFSGGWLLLAAGIYIGFSGPRTKIHSELRIRCSSTEDREALAKLKLALETGTSSEEFRENEGLLWLLNRYPP